MDEETTGVWLSAYVPNIRSMVNKVAPSAVSALYNKYDGYEWEVGANCSYSIVGVYGYYLE
ncbi:MAG: hypothetical protein JW800_03650 [Candidatus Omnitrophica bacterium]|nr:hypothetical protein [Candidatus Omnitrophota bacterium]